MAQFPTQPILSSFDRDDEEPLGDAGSWSGPLRPSPSTGDGTSTLTCGCGAVSLVVRHGRCDMAHARCAECGGEIWFGFEKPTS